MMQVSGSRSILPKEGRCSATFTVAKMRGQKSTTELSYKLNTTIKLIATIILRTLLVQACHTTQTSCAPLPAPGCTMSVDTDNGKLEVI